MKRSGTIELTMGLTAIIDLDDLPLLAEFNWHAAKCAGGKVYARTRTGVTAGREVISMHRLLMGNPRGAEVDHINGNSLDNRRENLRICSTASNQWNGRDKQKAKTSSYRGVYFAPHMGKWRASIKIAGKSKSLGSFENEVDAAKAYDAAVAAMRDSTALTNF